MPIHVVKSGETIYSIAQLYDVSADRIVYDNELAAQQNLVPGQALLILMTSRVHIVREGQTVKQIAEEYSITVKIYIKQSVSVESDLFVRGAEFGHFL